jgi:hypothetical protein
MTKHEETRLQNLCRKQGFETLGVREAQELKRLMAKKANELRPLLRKKTRK